MTVLFFFALFLMHIFDLEFFFFKDITLLFINILV